MRPSAQPFLWKWVLFAWEWKIISISKAEHLTSFWNKGPREPGNGLLTNPYCPVHTYGYLWIWIILGTDFSSSLLAFHLHVNVVFGHQKQVSQNGPPGRRFKNTGFSFMYQTRSDLSLIHVVRNIERFTYVANVGTKKTFSKEQTSTPTGLSWYTIMVITPCENALLGVTINKLVF